MAAQSGGRINFTKIGIAVLDELTGIFRELLTSEVKPSLIATKVKCSATLRKLRPDQALLVNKANTTGYTDFDITLLYTLLRNECPNIPPPTRGWGVDPGSLDITVGDDIERIRFIRNKVLGHISTAFVSDLEFQSIWAEIEAICQRMQTHLGSTHNYVQNIKKLESQSVDEELETTYIEKLQSIVDNEKDLTEMIQALSSKVEDVKTDVKELKSLSGKHKLEAKTEIDIEIGPEKKRKQGSGVNLLNMAYQYLNRIIRSITEDSTVEEYLEVCKELEECGKSIEDKEGLQRFFEIIEDFETITHNFAQEHVDKTKQVSIFSRFVKLVIEIRKYKGEIEVKHSSLILHMTFQHKEDFFRYQQDVQGGEIKRLFAECLLFKPFLSIFDLSPCDVNINLIDVSKHEDDNAIPKYHTVEDDYISPDDGLEDDYISPDDGLEDDYTSPDDGVDDDYTSPDDGVDDDDIPSFHAVEELFCKLPLDMLSFLRCLLLSKDFLIHLRNEEWQSTFKKMHATDMPTEDIINTVKKILNEHNLIQINDERISFRKSYIRDACMRHWFENRSTSDINLFLYEASITTVERYLNPTYGFWKPDWIFRLWKLTDRDINSFVQTFRIDVITRPVFEVLWISKMVVEILKLPRELTYWDIESRVRYAEAMKRGGITVFRTKAMIVGCAGAGKTTLVKRLRNQRFFCLGGVSSTVGLQVHYNIFEVDEQTQKLLAYSLKNQQEGIDVRHALSKDSTKKLLSLVDFGGRCAYYAFHQVYLTERAIYLLVVDMSKDFEETIDASICQQHGTMFENWTYKDYFIFWLKFIHMYCGDNTPVILIPTHCENMTDQEISQVYDTLWNLLPQGSNLHHHIERQRCFPLRFPNFYKSFEKSCPKDLEKCIVETVQQHRSWGDYIPTAWLQFEALIQEKKSKKIIELEMLKKQWFALDQSDSFKDILRFYHEIGVILYFEEEGLGNHIILDIQWFVDSFKYIIADSSHTKDVVSAPQGWGEFDKTGVLSDDLLQKIWKSKSLLSEIETHKDVVLLYMQRLGLIAVGEQLHYIPSMNKRGLEQGRKNSILNSKNKSSVLYYKFNFLPFFIFHRLIVSCLKVIKWQPLTDDYECIYRDVGIFQYRDHKIVLAASTNYIQAHVFASFEVQKGVVLDIRKALEEQIEQLSKTFHKNINYEVGYSCGQVTMCENIDGSFIDEETVRKKKTVDCPRHSLLKDHTIIAREILFYWVPENAWQDEQDVNNTSKNFQRFSSLLNLGVEAVRMIFNEIIPQQDLTTLLSQNKEDITRGRYKISKEEIPLLYPAGNTIVSSMDMDITLMYKFLRTFTNIGAPSKGWGETPDVGDIEKADDIERIRHHRNYLVHLNPQMIKSTMFKQRWSDLSLAVERLSEGTLTSRINEI